MDSNLIELLKAWQLAEYIPVFVENKITIDTLGLLDSDVIKELIGPVGDRVRFQNNLKQWNELTNSLEGCDNFVTKLRHPTLSEYENIFKQDEQPSVRSSTPINSPVHNDNALNDVTNVILLPTSSETSISTPPQSISLTPDYNNVELSASTSTSSFSFIDSYAISASNEAINLPFKYTGLKDLLNTSLEGKGLLNLYSESGLLSSNGRRKICNIIVKHIIEKDPLERVSGSILLKYAQEITTLFRKENICTYFVPYISNNKLKVRRLAKGKLYDCLQNRKREYREASKYKSNKEKTEEILSTETGNHGNQSPTEHNEDINWLKNSCDPWDTVAEKWRKTAEFRRGEVMKEGNTIESYMKTYPALQKPVGFHLLLSDFAYHYPTYTDNFKENFPLYKQKVIDLTIKKFSKHPDQGLKALIEEYINAINEEEATAVETKSICALMFLPLLLGNPVAKNKKKCWRPSKQEARESFITHVKAEVDLKQSITTRKEKYVTLGLTFQPTIFIVGPSINNIKNYYVVVNDIFYVVNSIVEAVDVTFKVFHSLHCEYPTECCTVYSFLQKGLYKLSTQWDKEFTSVNALLADLDIK